MERRVQFDLFGQEFSFYTDSSEEEVSKVINMVKAELGDLAKGGRRSLLSNKMLVLCCLKICAQYIELEKEFNQFKNCQDKSIDKLISKVTSSIGKENP